MTRPSILIIDDTFVKASYRALLEDHGFSCHEVNDASSAVFLLSNDQSIALVLCDMNLPRSAALTFLETIQTDDRLKRMPILMVANGAFPELIYRGTKLGVRQWILKPFKNEQLVAAVKKAIE